MKYSFGTHDGTFHADEVTACALLLLFNLIDPETVVRTRDLEILKNCEYVCDVGGIYDESIKRFDHHQVSYQGDFSSAGMILKYLLDKSYINEVEYLLFNNSLIRWVDAFDNGRATASLGYCSFSNVISNFLPIPHDASKEEMNEAFFEAVSLTLGHLKRLYERFKYNQSCAYLVEEAMKKYTECLIFEESIPWMDSFFELGGEGHPARFIIMPSGMHWKLRCIPPSQEEKIKVREALPKNWEGLLDKELKSVTGIEGAIFCHKGRFISVWETKEAALKALKLIQQERK